jgi:hypothetical protein
VQLGNEGSGGVPLLQNVKKITESGESAEWDTVVEGFEKELESDGGRHAAIIA